MRSFKEAALLVAALSVAACGGPSGKQGGIQLGVSMQASTADPLGTIATVEYVATSPSYNVSGLIAKGADGRWTLTLDAVPAGTVNFVVTAFDAGHVALFRTPAGGQNVVVTAGSTANVTIFLQELNHAAPFTGLTPFVSAVQTAVDQSAAGQTTYTFTATVGGPTGLTVTWTGPVTITAPQTPVGGVVTNTFVATANGTYAFSIRVTDGVSTATYSFSVVVDLRGGTVIVVDFNAWPLIDVANPMVVVDAVGNPAQAQPAAGDAVIVSAGAVDPDGDVVKLAWSTTCPIVSGSAVETQAAFALGLATGTFTFTLAPTAVPLGTCDVVVTMADYAAGPLDGGGNPTLGTARGGLNTGTLTLTVGPPPVTGP